MSQAHQDILLLTNNFVLVPRCPAEYEIACVGYSYSLLSDMNAKGLYRFDVTSHYMFTLSCAVNETCVDISDLRSTLARFL